MTASDRNPRPTVLAVWLVVAGTVGWSAAFALLTERLHLLADPTATASCDFSVLIQCGKNLESWQGMLLGFPNPIIGLSTWIAPIVVGAALLAGARFARWFWALFALGVTVAMGFVIWLIVQSIFVLGTLCPWCMVTWLVTIPTFFAVVLHVLARGLVPAPSAVRRAADALLGWIPVLAVSSYAVIAIVAQLRLDVIGSLV